MGAVLLAEQGAASITPAAVVGEPRAYSIETHYRLKPGEGIYGLGAHQAGVMNYRGHTVKLVQANTQSANPFLGARRGGQGPRLLLGDDAVQGPRRDQPG